MEHYDLIVAGAGPAGSECARRAAELGLSVLVLERASFPRAKACAGGLTSVSRNLLGDGVEAAIHANVGVVEVRLGSRLRLVWRSPDPTVVTTERDELDDALVSGASRAGARIEFDTAVRALREEPGGVVVEAGAAPRSARFLVGADGARSLVRRAAGLAAPSMAAAVFVRAFPSRDDSMARYRGRVLLDFSRGRRGYIWIFPKRDHLNIGIYSQHALASWQRDTLLDYVGRLDLDGWRFGRAVGSVVPRSVARSGLVRGRVLLAGDAAGLADPVTGEGIGHAVVSGRIAAEAAARADDPATVRDLYARRVEAEVLPDVRAGGFLGSLFYTLGPRISEGVLSCPPVLASVRRFGPWDRLVSVYGRLSVERGGREGLATE